jgi:hypothetical protein
MSSLYRRLAKFLLVLFFFGWITYPGWWNEWYTDAPEQYAYPASLSSPKDPHWGFWFW